jgi:hypothetical protein
MRNIKARLFIEGDIITYGYGGFYQAPKGWGMDLAYFRRSDFSWFSFGNGHIEEYILQRAESEYKSGRLKEMFLPKFFAHLAHVCQYEWQFEQSRTLFEYCRAKYASFKRYENFTQFAGECIGGSGGMHPGRLLDVVKERVAVMMKVSPDEVLRSQRGLIARHAADVLKRVLERTFGDADAHYLFQKIQKAGKGQISLILDGSEKNFLLTAAFEGMIGNFFDQRMKAYTAPEYVKEALRSLNVESNPDKNIREARRDTLRAFKQMHSELPELLSVMRLPIFIATSNNANYFRNFFNTIPLYVARGMDELQEYQVFGLCMYEPYYQGGIIATRGGREYPRFWHTLVEETSHLADGPTDRMRMLGHHRYSGTKAFNDAYLQDRAGNPPWARAGTLGVKEWAQAMTLRKLNHLAVWRAKGRIESFEATMDFDHYLPEQRNAEVFAALPIVERAVGKRVARKVMPQLFAYYDSAYLEGLRAEVRDLKKRVKD